jgi:HEAT repeat protein
MQCKVTVIAVMIASVVTAQALPASAYAFPDPPPAPTIEIIDSPMYKSPDLPKPNVEWVFPEGAKKLWIAALDRPEAEMKCKAADAIARAHAQGVKGLDSAVASLLAIFEQPGQQPVVRLAAVRALVTLDARNTAPRLFDQLQRVDADMRDVVEPALARWDYRPMRSVWLSRLNEAAPRTRQLALAIQGLTAVGEQEAVEPLRKLVLSDRSDTMIRLEAARALGRLRETGLEKDAEELAGDSSTVAARLCAVKLLERHSSQAAVQALQSLIRDKQPTVAGAAIERLIAIDAKLVVPSLDHVLASADPQLRSLGIDVLFREPSDKHIDLLAERLEDSHPDVRGKARQGLLKLAARKQWKDRIIAKVTETQATQRWRELEQATILLAQLDHKPAASRMLELLDFEREEVFVAAAWGLRKLAVPDTVPVVVQHIRAKAFKSDKPPARTMNPDWADIGVSQLIQLLGQQREPSVDELWRAFIPKPFGSNLTVAHESRAAAIWSLGLLHEGKNVPDLAAALEVRLNDTRSIPPEDNRVRWMCAIALGRMKSTGTIMSIHSHFIHNEPSDDPVNNACGWAVEQITGKKMLPPKTIRKPQRDWFLIPRQQVQN